MIHLELENEDVPVTYLEVEVDLGDERIYFCSGPHLIDVTNIITPEYREQLIYDAIHATADAEVERSIDRYREESIL